MMYDENNVNLNLDKQNDGTKSCPFCGAVVSDKYDVCPVCGTIISPQYSEAKNEYNRVMQENKTKSDGHDFAIASMCCGIGSLLFCWYFLFAVGFGIAGIILSCQAKKKGDKTGFRTAGLVTSIIGISLSLLLIMFIIGIFGVFIASAPY